MQQDLNIFLLNATKVQSNAKCLKIYMTLSDEETQGEGAEKKGGEQKYVLNNYCINVR